jgi:alkylation response protein AidB-like acyl-CoA dehydrogenase
VEFDLTAEQARLQQAAIEFARASLCEDMIGRDRDELFDRGLWRSCAEFGVLGMPVPEVYGGFGLDLSTLLAVMEGLGYGAKDQGLLFSLNAHLWTNTLPILEYGTEQQKTTWLPGLCDGTLIGANGASEPNAGSDVFAMRTRAVRDGDEYVLNGVKTFVSNAPVADLFVVYATVDPALGPLGVTAFVVERDRPGLQVTKRLGKMGLRTSPMAEVVFDGCRVPVSNRLGREGRGATVFETSMEWERGCILASCLGVMRRQLERCISHVQQRKQFGRSIGSFQAVSHRIVDMELRLETTRPLVYKIGWLKGQGKDATLAAALAKLHVSDCFVKSSIDAMQIFGGYGYMVEQEIERDVRDALASTLYSGTTEIQRNIVARALGLQTGR